MNSPIMTSRGKLYISQNESVHGTFQTHSTIFIGQFQVVIRWWWIQLEVQTWEEYISS